MENLLEDRADEGIGDGKKDQIESLRPIESMSEKVISDLNKRKFWNALFFHIILNAWSIFPYACSDYTMPHTENKDK